MAWFANIRNLDELKAAFRRLALIHHPDHGGDPTIMRSILAEYTSLRSRMEARRHEQRMREEAARAKEEKRRFAQKMREEMNRQKMEEEKYWNEKKRRAEEQRKRRAERERSEKERRRQKRGEEEAWRKSMDDAAKNFSRVFQGNLFDCAWFK